ncbi:uncharacterized protein [Mycetomoellerius zeteki]|uniref:uncharacterized protein n=1 Tax=Mycetomoellerius zeteki TaxID=64791 RepID=UPI00084EBD5E|nr:PREDICTED: uncharacterized protein LOC108720219 [Trachymyrmex zeteki]
MDYSEIFEDDSDDRTTTFSLIAGESTDKGCTKHLGIIARYFDSERIRDSFLALIPMKDAKADDIYGKIIKFFTTHNIPYKKNLIGFASDGVNVLAGQNNSVMTSFSLYANYACKKLPREVEDLVRDVYNYISNSPKRTAFYQEFQKFTEIPVHKILHLAQTRWLSLPKQHK